MPISLSDYAKIIEKSVAPIGATVELDLVTDNLVVVLGEKGFAITRKYLSDHGPETVAKDAQTVVSDIAAGKEESMCKRFSAPLKIRSREGLWPRHLTTHFDSV